MSLTTWTAVLTINTAGDDEPENLHRVRLQPMPTPDGAIEQGLYLMSRVDGAVDFVVERGAVAA
ncbi:hypothetical protein [Azohydromonas sp.]|uniref:hypothetical protein n=1 Tax=Azohydromonas sp. TaxID=1872666 RepID=UPI002C9C34C9|nr:hypothetical protein [Azohydromonas sp.]HMM85779.1 hypothetical protein [Azohydromonas sp.]